MAIHGLMHRGLICSLALLAALAVFVSSPTFGQVGTSMAANISPDRSAAEAQRRLVLSRRRRLQEAQENAQFNQLLTTRTQLPIESTAKLPHRPVAMHRGTTPLGRRSATPAHRPE
jgi:hypothetical protein